MTKVSLRANVIEISEWINTVIIQIYSIIVLQFTP